MKRLPTRIVHNTRRENPDKALAPPIAQTSTFYFDSIEDAQKAFKFETDDYVYTRGNNPTLRLLEEKIANLEEGAGAVAFASGMAAISSVLFSLLKPGDHGLFHKTLYGSTHGVAKKLLPENGIETSFADFTNLDDLYHKLQDNTKLIYFETPANPSLDVVDIKKISQIARERDIKVVVDNTFLSPYFQRPLTLGADVVVHSATKYISGHGDVVAGLAIARDLDYVHRLKFDYMCEFGGVMSPFNAWLLLRGLKTLHVRLDRHEENALALAKYLELHEEVTSVRYPGLASYPYKDIVDKQMDGFGGVLTFEVKGGLERACAVVDAVELMRIAVSLGDVETLIEMPAAMTHFGYDKDSLKEFGLSQTMIRISVGLEDVEDLIEDISNALEATK